MRVVIATCQADFAGRLTVHLPMAKRLLLLKADGSISVHADDRAYKPLNWMNPPCTLTEEEPTDGLEAVWLFKGANGDTLKIQIQEVFLDTSHALGTDPGLQKDGVEAHLQKLVAEHPQVLGPGLQLITREYQTPIGPVDLLCRDSAGAYVAVEIKRQGGMDGVEQLTRYLELLNRDPLLAPVRGVFAAQSIRPQAITMATDRGIQCAILDYDAMRGMDNAEDRLF